MTNRSLYFAAKTKDGYHAFKYLHQALKAAERQPDGTKRVSQVWLKLSEYCKLQA